MSLSEFATVLPIIFPIIFGIILLGLKLDERKPREIYIMAVVVLTSIMALYAIYCTEGTAMLIQFDSKLSLAFHIDGLSKIFGTMVSLLWIVTTVYAFEYMTHEGGERRFFAYYLMTFGVVLGIAFAGNFLTMYLFYEFLTLATLPLVMHAMDDKARHAGKSYILYMMFGAALALCGFIYIYGYGSSLDFVYGGTLVGNIDESDLLTLQLVFVITFFGFGVKAAVMPFHRWLPEASVAPTPVTALLHAVAVVKSGVFAIIRLLYFSFGTTYLVNTWAQYVMLIAVSLTIVYGSTVALRTPHIKRRFAYSTISNLSYILFGVALMTPLGLAAGLLHMVYHALIKITLFFTAGAILYKTHREYLYEVEGFGPLMPVTFFAMSITGIALVGVPPLAGFHSKWALATASVQSHNLVSYIGIVALIASALLTSLYIFYIIARAYAPRKRDYPAQYYHGVSDPNWYMRAPLVVLVIAVILASLFPDALFTFFFDVASGTV